MRMSKVFLFASFTGGPVGRRSGGARYERTIKSCYADGFPDPSAGRAAATSGRDAQQRVTVCAANPAAAHPPGSTG